MPREASRPGDASTTFHVSAWVSGNGFGRLTVRVGSIEFKPGRTTRFGLRLDGPLTHRRREVTVATSPLWFGQMMLTLSADTVDDMIVQSVPLGPLKTWLKTWLPKTEARPLPFINVIALPWQRGRLRRALRSAGFVEHVVRRWFIPFWRPLEQE